LIQPKSPASNPTAGSRNFKNKDGCEKGKPFGRFSLLALFLFQTSFPGGIFPTSKPLGKMRGLRVINLCRYIFPFSLVDGEALLERLVVSIWAMTTGSQMIVISLWGLYRLGLG